MNQLNPIKILSIEDHPVFRFGLSTTIGSRADMLLVAQADNGREGFLHFQEFRPDITLLDLRLPDVDGLALLTNMRSHRKDARIIVLTTSDNDTDIQKL